MQLPWQESCEITPPPLLSLPSPIRYPQDSETGQMEAKASYAKGSVIMNLDCLHTNTRRWRRHVHRCFIIMGRVNQPNLAQSLWLTSEINDLSLTTIGCTFTGICNGMCFLDSFDNFCSDKSGDSMCQVSCRWLLNPRRSSKK